MKLLEGLKGKYKDIVSSPEFIWESRQTIGATYNVYIPARGRLKFFEPCVRYLLNAAEHANIKLSIFLIENDTTPFYRTISDKLGVSYIFITSEVSCSDGFFAKSLCFNIGYILSDPTFWGIYHDLDMIVGENFFKDLGIHLAKEPNWLQPYREKRVMRLGLYSTDLITNNPMVVHPVTCFSDAKPANPGSPGGSIVVRDTDFLKVGGYDPEFFWGYAPEDSFFWAKLECLYSGISLPIQNLMLGGASYADDPPMDVYHLDHPLQESQNPNLQGMLSIQKYFFNISGEDRRKILNIKKDILEKAIIEIRDCK